MNIEALGWNGKANRARAMIDTSILTDACVSVYERRIAKELVEWDERDERSRRRFRFGATKRGSFSSVYVKLYKSYSLFMAAVAAFTRALQAGSGSLSLSDSVTVASEFTPMSCNTVGAGVS